MANSEQELAGAISRAVAGAVSSVLSQRAVTPTGTMANTEPGADQVIRCVFRMSKDDLN